MHIVYLSNPGTIAISGTHPLQHNWTVIIRRNPVVYTSAKTLSLTLNPNPNPIFYQDKLENYGINVTPDKIRFRTHKVKTSLKVI